MTSCSSSSIFNRNDMVSIVGLTDEEVTCFCRVISLSKDSIASLHCKNGNLYQIPVTYLKKCETEVYTDW